MADFIFNISKGRFVEFNVRVDGNDPTASEVNMIVLNVTGIEADSVLIDKNDFADLVVGATVEVTNSGYAGERLSDTDLATPAVDDGNDRFDITYPDRTFTSIVAGDVWNDLVIGYDPLGTDVHSNIIPMSLHDFVVTPNGGNIVADFDATATQRAA